MGKKQVDVFATEGLSLNLSGSADGRDGRGISNTQTLWLWQTKLQLVFQRRTFKLQVVLYI